MSTVQMNTARPIEYAPVERVAPIYRTNQSGQEGKHTLALTAKETALLAKEKQPSYFDVSRLNEEEKEKLEFELKKLNDSLASAGKILKFKYDEDAETSYVEVIDASTQKVVASLPPEFLIDLSVKMKEIIGMFIDEKL